MATGMQDGHRDHARQLTECGKGLLWALPSAFGSNPAPCVVSKHPFLPRPFCQHPSETGQAVPTGLGGPDTAFGNAVLLTDAQPGCS